VDLATQGLSNESAHDVVTAGSTAQKGKSPLKVSLQPFGVYMGEVTK
jgi:hypothetical protein